MLALATFLMLSPAIFLIGDFSYARSVDRSYREWERELERGADGVREGSGAFSCGVGGGEGAALFVHGFGSSPAIFSRMAPCLAEEGFECRVMRLPGFGEPLASFRRYTDEEWRAAVLDEALALRTQDRPLWIVAHSMGAPLVLRVLKEQPDLADGVILLAPLVEVSRKRSLGIAPEGIYKFLNPLLVFSDTFKTCFAVDMNDKTVTGLDRRDLFVPRRVYTNMFNLLEELPAAEAALELPVLVVVSRNDKVIDYRAAERLYGRLPGAVKQIHYEDRSGHVLPLDFGWREVSQHMATFIRMADHARQAQ